MTPDQLAAFTDLAREAAQIEDRQERLTAFAVILAPFSREQIALLFASLARVALLSPEGEHHADY